MFKTRTARILYDIMTENAISIINTALSKVDQLDPPSTEKITLYLDVSSWAAEQERKNLKFAFEIDAMKLDDEVILVPINTSGELN